jgi:ABC-type nitrate/sulfonate/bicarbonate transport system permease component
VRTDDTLGVSGEGAGPSLGVDVERELLTAPGVAVAPAPRRRLRISRFLVGSIVPLLLIALWTILSEGHAVSQVVLPSPTSVYDVAVAIRSELPSALLVTLEMVFGGLLIGGVTGIFVGLLFGYSGALRQLFELTLDLVRPVPLFALIPLFILWFGIGRAPQIALVAFGTFLLLTIETLEAVRNVPHIYVKAALTTGASRYSAYRTVIIPAIVPHLIAGVRFAAASAWGLDVAAEFTGSQRGLGYIMIEREQYLDTAGITLIVFIFSALAILLDWMIRLGFYKLTRWAPRRTGGDLVGRMLGRS